MNPKEAQKLVNNLTGNRNQKESKGRSGFSQKIADLILSNNGTNVSECGLALYPDDYSPALDASAAKGKSTRKVMRETRAGLARKGLNVYKIKISGYDEITIACKPEDAKANVAKWRADGADDIHQLFQNS